MYNFIIIPNCLKILPIPEKVLPLLEGKDFDKLIWSSAGLPINGATYSLNDKSLYYEFDSTGKYDIKKTDFTGHVSAGIYVINKNTEDKNYMLVFDLTFVKGELLEVELGKCEEQDAKKFNETVNNITTKTNKILKFRKSFWYRYLYLPYVIIIKSIFWILMYILDNLYMFLDKILKKITPI